MFNQIGINPLFRVSGYFFCSILATLIIIIFTSNAASAAFFYIDPENGSMEGDGSIDSPWSSLQEVWDQGMIETSYWEMPYTENSEKLAKNSGAIIKGGDTIFLHGGYHGDLSIQDALNDEFITLKAVEGEKPLFGTIFMRAVSRWTIDGLSVSPSHAPVFELPHQIIRVENHSYRGPSSYVNIINSEVFSVPDISSFTEQEWNDNVSSGITSRGTDYLNIENNNIYNIMIGAVYHSCDHGIIRNNSIDRIGVDGIEFPDSDYITIEYNTIKNSYQVTELHNDMMQSWTVGGVPVVGAVIRGNTMIGHEEESYPYMATVQGIGMFDGFYEDFLIEDNMMVINHWHGITLTGARNCTVRNNTLLTIYDLPYPDTNIIRFIKHKDGSLGSGNLIINNFAEGIDEISAVEGGATIVNNIEGESIYDHFVDPDNFDFRLLETSTMIDAADTSSYSSVDIKQNPRDSRPDIGALEYGAEDSQEIRADVNQDQIINSSDALLVLRKALGRSMTGTEWRNSSSSGDVNCDQQVNTADALLVLREHLGLDVSGLGWCEG